MIKTLKSELKLRPTYDEMIGIIETQGNPNRPPVEQVIDRKATIFRNNQFGSQFDNVDFLGLKKQEEDRARENLRQSQLKNAGIEAGTSTGIMNLRAMGFETPEINEEDFVYETLDGDELSVEEAVKIRAEMERYTQRQAEAQQETASSAKSDLDEAHRQSIPASVDMFRKDTGRSDDLPPLIDIPPETRLKQPSSSSSGIVGAIASGAKELGGAVLEAGKEAVKEAVVAGARSAVMSLI